MKQYCLLWIAFIGCSSGESTTAYDGSRTGGGGSSADGGTETQGSAGQSLPTPDPFEETPSKCGDESCNGDETCEICSIDCGECPKCDSAPTCTGAVAIPIESSVKARNDLSSYTKNEAPVEIANSTPVEPKADTNCLDAKLRIRLKSLKTHGVGGNALSARYLYCVINASDGHTSQITVTGPTKDMKDGDVFQWDPSVAIVWGGKLGSGEDGELRSTQNNLTITYNCFRTNNTEGAAKVAGVVADSAREAGAVGGSYGWAFGIGSVAADLISGALDAAKGDTHVLNETKTIDKKHMLDLTNARTWSVREANDTLQPIWDRWDWELTMEAWGCANARAATPR